MVIYDNTLEVNMILYLMWIPIAGVLYFALGFMGFWD
jgi:hypothetical protein